MRRARFREIAGQLRVRIAQDATYVPASIAQVMTEFDASAATASKAVRELVREGLIVCKPGTGIRRATASEAEPLYTTLKTLIQSGEWRDGERVPKSSYLVSRYHVSAATVSRVLRHLGDEVLIHKRGKSWIVGQPSAAPDNAIPSCLGPRVLILCVSITEQTPSNLFVLPFLEALRAELRTPGIDLVYGYRLQDAQIDAAHIPHQGSKAVGVAIREWGDLYRGAVIMDLWIDPEEIREWVKVLSASGKKPVIFFDHSGDLQSHTRGSLALGDNYHFVYFDQEGAVRLALQRLADSGHRIVGVPVPPWEHGEWLGTRLELTKKIAGTVRPSIEVLPPATLDETFGQNASSSPQILLSSGIFTRRFTELSKTPAAGERVRSATRQITPRQLIGSTPSLTSLILQGATALLCVNDHVAQLCYLWCMAVGLRVPQDLSLVSFDNAREYQITPLATVDFGFSRLGYLAGRILRGARPGEAGRDGSIAGVCTLVNRGSLGPPNGRTARRVNAMMNG